MALSRLKCQIPSIKQLQLPQLNLFNRVLNFYANLPYDSKNISSWFGKKDKERKSTKKSGKPKPQVLLKSKCRPRVPQCPEFICTGAPSKCIEGGYGDPLSKFFSIRYRPRSWVKQKPSNCPPTPCEKVDTFWQYIFGHAKPLPHPNTCRMAYKYKQMRNAEDPRLADPKYQLTCGDVLIHTEEVNAFCLTPKKFGTEPTSPSPFKVPSSVLCKSINDSVSMLDCYCACVPKKKEPCDSNLCPVHAWTNQRPYEEMRPLKPRRTFFTCKRGIPSRDVIRPPRYTECSCSQPRIEIRQVSMEFPPRADCCAQRRQSQVDLREAGVNPTRGKKMSRCERLKEVTSNWESDMNVSKFVRKPPLPSCTSKCRCSRVGQMKSAW